MRKLLLGFAALCAMNSALAQPIIQTTIREIQSTPLSSLERRQDASPLVGSRVKVRGVVLIPGTANVSSSESNPNRHVWIRQVGGGPFSTIGFRRAGNTTPTDMRDLQVGDTVDVVGYVEEFSTGPTAVRDSLLGGETQLNPDSVRVISLYEPGSPKPAPTPIEMRNLNTVRLQDSISLGEQYEGDYVELSNVRVVAVDRFFASNASRVSFTVQDEFGNRMNIGDRFFAQRLPNCTTSPVNLCGRFVPPSVGDVFRKIRGIVLHAKLTSQGNRSRGYEVHPFDSVDYEKGRSAPFVININNNPIKPTSTQNCLITAQITDGTDSLGRRAEITRAMLYYTRLANDATSVTTYTDSLPLIRLGASDLFNATIPSQPDGSIVAYYISVSNNQGLTTNAPDVSRPIADLPESPRFYWVYDRSLRIADIQRNPLVPARDANDRNQINNTVSGSIGAQVTVSGIVTVDTSFSGRVFFMQDATGRDFAGIMVRVANESDLRNLRKGQTVTVTGTVLEDAQMTYLLASNVVVENQPLTAILPLEVPLTEFNVGAASQNGATNWSLAKEKYEGQLVRIVNLSGNLFVSNVNFKSSLNSPATANFGEWKVALDSNDTNGPIILSGFRSSTSNLFVSSRYNQYVNSVDTSNRLRVTPIIIRRGQEFAAITGVVYHSFGILKLIPRDGSDVWLTPQSANGAINNLVAMFPNPATESVNINLNTENASGYSAAFTDLSGRTVKRTTLTSVNNAVSVANLNNGLYVVSVTDASGKLVFRNKLNIVK